MNTGGECKHNDNRVESTSKNKQKIAIQKEYIRPDKSNYLSKIVLCSILFYFINDEFCLLLKMYFIQFNVVIDIHR